jgi:glycosyltransferase involved in cell wall biosynthesis
MKLLLFNLATDADDPILGFTTTWIGALARRVKRVHVITMRAGRIVVADNVSVHSVGKEKGYSEGRRAVEFYRHLFRVLREDQIDACFSHMIPIFSVLGAPVLKMRGIPIVTWYAHPQATRLLAMSQYVSDRVVTSLPTAYPRKSEKVTVVGQGIDTELFRPNGEVPVAPPMILCAGRLSPVKDHRTLLKAAAIVRERWSGSFQVVIVGRPSDREEETYAEALRAQVLELGIGDVVRFEAAVPMSALPSWYRRCTIHVNLTPTGFGDKVALEAMSCGRPSVVANEGFGPTLGTYRAVLSFGHGDAQELAGKIIGLMGLSKEERDEMGRHLRERVVRAHSLDGLVDRLIEVFGAVSRAPST